MALLGLIARSRVTFAFAALLLVRTPSTRPALVRWLVAASLQVPGVLADAQTSTVACVSLRKVLGVAGSDRRRLTRLLRGQLHRAWPRRAGLVRWRSRAQRAVRDGDSAPAAAVGCGHTAPYQGVMEPSAARAAAKAMNTAIANSTIVPPDGVSA